MYRYLIIISIFFFAQNLIYAKNTDTLKVYFKNNQVKPVAKDSADFYRFILPPDTNTDKDQYRIFEYYNNGKAKMFTNSLTNTNDLVFDGNCITFYRNGSRKSVEQYKNGQQIGSASYYYPNNKVFEVVEIKEPLYYQNNPYYFQIQHSTYNYDFKIIELRDTLGNILVKNGNGRVIVFDEDLKNIVLEGDYKNYKKIGEWKGKIGDTASFILEFRNNRLKSGTTLTKSGNKYTFKNIIEPPEFSDGSEAFEIFLKRNIQLPETAIKRKIYGVVRINITIETNGTISHLIVESGLTKSINEEALRVVSLSPLWVPLKFFGIPLKSQRSVFVRMYRYN